MVSLFRRSRSALICNQLRELHKSADTFSVPTFKIDTEKKAFLDVLPEVVNSVVTAPNLSELPEVTRWLRQLLDYTLCGGKLLRGLKVPIGYRMFEDPTNFSEETQHSARILGWTMELSQAYLLLMDDMMDGATIRRGKPCWHQLPNIGLYAINDCTLIYQSMMQVLEKYFAKTPFFADLIKLFNEVLCRSSMGQHLDLTSGHNKHKNTLAEFTLDNYNSIAIYKTSYNSFKLPVFAALCLVKNGTEKATKEIEYICLELGRLLQIQDDYFDVYGDKTTIGKVGTDIQDGKCTWVSVTALQRCNETERSVFEEYYGSKDPEHVKRIKQLYDKLQMPQVYQQYKRCVCEDLLLRIRALPTEGETKFFLGLLHLYYKRLF